MHVFKYLDTIATKEEKARAGGSFDGHTTLRRTITPKHNISVLDQKSRRHHVDSGYSTCDGIDKRWSQELPISTAENASKWSPTPLHIRTESQPLVGNATNGNGLGDPSISPSSHRNGLHDELVYDDSVNTPPPSTNGDKRQNVTTPTIAASNSQPSR